jgi:hypothetical protein
VIAAQYGLDTVAGDVATVKDFTLLPRLESQPSPASIIPSDLTAKLQRYSAVASARSHSPRRNEITRNAIISAVWSSAH